jgi:hypothetical protein
VTTEEPVSYTREPRWAERTRAATIAAAKDAPAPPGPIAALLRRHADGSLVGTSSPAAERELLRSLQHGVGNASVARLLSRTPLSRDKTGADVPAPVYDQAAAGGKNVLDERAKRVVAIMADTKRTAEDRGVATVRAIVKEYYPSEESKVKDVVWDAKLDAGLETETGDGKDAKGTINVSQDFVDRFNLDNPSRWVLAVGHEILHINQHRAGGMGGPKHKAEREFLAHRWTVITPEAEGTGRLNASTKVGTIDVAVKHYYKMPEADRKKYQKEFDSLLELRKTTRASAKDPSKIPENPPTGEK